MSNDVAKLLWNTRERMTSTDLNTSRDLSYRMVQEAVRSLVMADVDVSGVISGLLCTVDSANRTVTVSQGLALVFDDTQTFPDSKLRWIEVQEPTIVDIPIGTGFERWDVIDIAPGTLVTDSRIVDVWDPTIPPSGSFVPQTVTKQEISSPVITIRVGTDPSGADPFFPLGAAGNIPLAYLRVDAGGGVGSVTTSIVRCRPLIRPKGDLDQTSALGSPVDVNSSTFVQGGGVDVDSDDASFVQMSACNGQFVKANHGFTVAGGTQIDMTVDEAWDGGARPGGDAIAYAYAIPPPYIETGYPTLAGREFVPGGGVFTDFATYQNTGLNQRNCCIVFHTFGPVNRVAGNQIGTANIHDVAFTQGLATPATSEREEWIYLGSFDQDGSFAKKQICRPGGTVIPVQRIPLTDLVTAGGFTTYDLREPHNSTGNPEDQGLLPAIAYDVQFIVFLRSTDAAPTDYHVEIDDEAVSGWTSPAQASPQRVRLTHSEGGASNIAQDKVFLRLPTNGDATFVSNTILVNFTAVNIRAISYVDAILALR